MKTRSTCSMVLSAAVIAVFGFTADAAMAGKGGEKGNSEGNGGGNSGNSSASSNSSSGGSRGAVASDLKKANGAVHSSNNAWANASANGVPGIARTLAEAQSGLDNFSGDIDQLRLDQAALEGAVSFDVYQAQINALDPADYTKEVLEGETLVEVPDEDAFDAEVERLEGLRDAADPRTSEEIAAELELTNAEIAEYEGYEEDKAAALAALIGDRELSPEALAELEARVQAYLATLP